MMQSSHDNRTRENKARMLILGLVQAMRRALYRRARQRNESQGAGGRGD
jgi:hypothetical protein